MQSVQGSTVKDKENTSNYTTHQSILPHDLPPSNKAKPSQAVSLSGAFRERSITYTLCRSMNTRSQPPVSVPTVQWHLGIRRVGSTRRFTRTTINHISRENSSVHEWLDSTKGDERLLQSLSVLSLLLSHIKDEGKLSAAVTPVSTIEFACFFCLFACSCSCRRGTVTRCMKPPPEKGPYGLLVSREEMPQDHWKPRSPTVRDYSTVMYQDRTERWENMPLWEESRVCGWQIDVGERYVTWLEE